MKVVLYGSKSLLEKILAMIVKYFGHKTNYITVCCSNGITKDLNKKDLLD